MNKCTFEKKKQKTVCFSSSHSLRFRPQLLYPRQLWVLQTLAMTSKFSQGQEASDAQIRNCYFHEKKCSRTREHAEECDEVEQLLHKENLK